MALRPQTNPPETKGTTILIKRLFHLLYSLILVQYAALCGWRLHANHDPINILFNAVTLACVVALVYLFQRERGGKQ